MRDGGLTPCPPPPLPLWLFFTRAQERDLLRAFRARLFDVQSELEKEKNKSDDGASAWIEKVGTGALRSPLRGLRSLVLRRSRCLSSCCLCVH